MCGGGCGNDQEEDVASVETWNQDEEEHFRRQERGHNIWDFDDFIGMEDEFDEDNIIGDFNRNANRASAMTNSGSIFAEIPDQIYQ